jgi:hypothetical protein
LPFKCNLQRYIAESRALGEHLRGMLASKEAALTEVSARANTAAGGALQVESS